MEMIELSVIFGLYVAGSLAFLYHMSKTHVEEREALLDRIMAISNPEALVTTKSVKDKTPARVAYMDEEGEFAYEREHGVTAVVGDVD